MSKHGRPPDLGRITSSAASAPAACLAAEASRPSPSFQTSVLVVLAIMQGCGRDEAAPHSQCTPRRTPLATQHLTPFPSALSTPPLQVRSEPPLGHLQSIVSISAHAWPRREFPILLRRAARMLRGAPIETTPPFTHNKALALVCSALTCLLVFSTAPWGLANKIEGI